MKTESIQRTLAGNDPHGISRALQDLTPDDCTIVDRRGKPVPLSGAGYVLHFGRAYHLRIVSPFADDDLQEVCLVSAPTFLTTAPAFTDVDENGRNVHVLPMRVTSDWLSIWSLLRRFGLGIDWDELEISQRFKPGKLRDAKPFLCPVVARPHWSVLLVLALFGVLALFVQKTLDHVIDPEKGDRLDALLQSLQRWDSWALMFGGVFALWCLVNSLNLCFLYQRTRELRRNYRETYSS
ncbi:MAG: hypothetical protein FJ271_31100 [Planctomycetes bacterium]|nr:hypothetical protein [Planctomycetota bacterium]